MSKPVSELRLDLVSNDWVVVAVGRAKRPETFAKYQRVKEEISKKKCPFCQPEILKEAILRRDRKDGHWSVIVIPNKYPAFAPSEDLYQRTEGPNKIMDGVGYHEVIITADHKKPISLFSNSEMKEVIDVYQARYLSLMNKKFIKYISIFYNHGQEAGASVVHPHSQLIAIPVIDPNLRGSIEGSANFYKKNNQCVYCTMIAWDLKDRQRLIYENEKFVVICPFAPQISFEVRVYPKRHSPYFEKLTNEDKEYFADALRVALKKLYRGLKDPAFNFYIHTAPCDGQEYNYYHWHLIILPKTSIWAGFELGTGIEISTILPEKAAEFLRKF